jgi:hypothetical protein
MYIESGPGTTLYLTDSWGYTGQLNIRFGSTVFERGNVGIGTVSPTYGLDINLNGGTLTAAGWGKTLRLSSGGAIVWDRSGGTNYFFQAKNTEGIYQGLLATDDGASWPNYTGRIDEVSGDWSWFKNTYLLGNVGIGTVSPTQKLDVAGVIRSSSGGYMFPDGTVQTTASLWQVFHTNTTVSTYWSHNGDTMYAYLDIYNSTWRLRRNIWCGHSSVWWGTAEAMNGTILTYAGKMTSADPYNSHDIRLENGQLCIYGDATALACVQIP